MRLESKNGIKETKTFKMKQFQYLSIFIIVILFSACGSSTADRSKTIAATEANASVTKLEVIDFYSTRRCKTCKAIEANTINTLETHFGDELMSGNISLRIINIDDEKNHEIAERFEAAGTALFLNLIANGQETHTDLTNFAFKNGLNEEVFSKELKSMITAELKKL